MGTGDCVCACNNVFMLGGPVRTAAAVLYHLPGVDEAGGAHHARVLQKLRRPGAGDGEKH